MSGTEHPFLGSKKTQGSAAAARRGRARQPPVRTHRNACARRRSKRPPSHPNTRDNAGKQCSARPASEGHSVNTIVIVAVILSVAATIWIGFKHRRRMRHHRDPRDGPLRRANQPHPPRGHHVIIDILIVAALATTIHLLWAAARAKLRKPDTRPIRIRKARNGLWFVQQGHIAPTVLSTAVNDWEAGAAANRIIKEAK